MFNQAEFIKNNLLGGFQNGTWNEFQVNIFAMNYLLRGVITQQDFDEIMVAMQPSEEIEGLID